MSSANTIDAIISHVATLNGQSESDDGYIDVDNMDNVGDTGLS